MTKTHSLPAGFTKALIASGFWIMVLECIRRLLDRSADDKGGLS